MLIESPIPTFITPIIKPNQQGSEQLGAGEAGRKEDGHAQMSKKKGKHAFSRSPHSLIKNNFKMYSFYL